MRKTTVNNLSYFNSLVIDRSIDRGLHDRTLEAIATALNAVLSIPMCEPLTKHAEGFLKDIEKVYRKHFGAESVATKDLKHYLAVVEMIEARRITNKRSRDLAIAQVVRKINRHKLNSGDLARHHIARLKAEPQRRGRGSRKSAEDTIKMIPYFLENYYERKYYEHKSSLADLENEHLRATANPLKIEDAFYILLRRFCGLDHESASAVRDCAIENGLHFPPDTKASKQAEILFGVKSLENVFR